MRTTPRTPHPPRLRAARSGAPPHHRKPQGFERVGRFLKTRCPPPAMRPGACI